MYQYHSDVCVWTIWLDQKQNKRLIILTLLLYLTRSKTNIMTVSYLPFCSFWDSRKNPHMTNILLTVWLSKTNMTDILILLFLLLILLFLLFDSVKNKHNDCILLTLLSRRLLTPWFWLLESKTNIKLYHTVPFFSDYWVLYSILRAANNWSWIITNESKVTFVHNFLFTIVDYMHASSWGNFFLTYWHLFFVESTFYFILHLAFLINIIINYIVFYMYMNDVTTWRATH